jgi:nucleoside-diphosphate-sugar epimerase
MSGRDAVLAGGTGLVGAELLRLLACAGDYARVLAPTRRALPLQHPRIEPRPARFDALDEALAGAHAGCDVFCCLGTTIRSAGSREAFRAVDHGMVVALARWAKRHRARRFVLFSGALQGAASR